MSRAVVECVSVGPAGEGGLGRMVGGLGGPGGRGPLVMRMAGDWGILPVALRDDCGRERGRRKDPPGNGGS